ncbi:hypothetical protein L9F63_011367 [Diploptera punctata]|uniref:Ubiquitin carboxyl-terminal hydrolase n=1 Tax=Diploptera punctata TaxID=6984 RepID=A0AAD8AER4_DIPPU|nr:hypothetical protein L9F63_011367 [Diploptera punctata]
MAECVDADTETQRKLIELFIGKQMRKGETWYLIDTNWFKAFRRYVGIYDIWETVDKQDDYPGPIDNSSLFNEDGSIRELLTDGLDYVLVPKDAWELLVKWYGTINTNTAIPRQVVEYGLFVKHYKAEVYLQHLRFCKNFKKETEVSQEVSKTHTIGYIEKLMRKTYGISNNEEVRLWTCFDPNSCDELTKPEETVQDIGFYQNQILVIETKSSDRNWLRSYRSSYFRSTRFNPDRNPADSKASPGLCGLCNMGNTCFMNSVLQCMSNCPPITNFFLSDEHLNELNEENPLGMRGEIAKSFGDLMKTMWSGKHAYTMPRNFKLQVGKFAPQFSGYQQHDAQELLTFLLDGLHEDLNRIKKKPYIELQDSSGRPDKEIASEAWENYRKRNDSVIVDFFHGLLKSTVVCPDCDKVSITFDPFCYLSLPLPTKKEKALEVLLFHYDPVLKPTHYTVFVPKRGLIKDLVSNVGRLSGVPSDHLIVTDVTKCHFHKFFASNDPVEEIKDKDVIYIYEIPLSNNTNVIIPVILWEAAGKQLFNYEQLFGDPLLIAAPRKDCTYDVLYQIIIHKLRRCLRMPDDNSSWWVSKSKISNADLTFTDKDDEESLANENDRSCTDENEEKGGDSSIRRKLFSICLITEGSKECMKLHNDGNQLQFPKYMGESFIALRWSQDARKRFFSVKSLRDTEDQSYRNNLQVIKLRDCIELYTTREKLGANDAWYCPKCKKHQQATKKFDLWSLPRILIIHLKRFVYNRYRSDKVDRTVNYPLGGLDMSDYVINKSEPEVIYDLIGVCNHYGGMAGGHYTAFCINQNDQRWHLFDDNAVNPINEQDVISNAAYVLFYMRRNTSNEKMELN